MGKKHNRRHLLVLAAATAGTSALAACADDTVEDDIGPTGSNGASTGAAGGNGASVFPEGYTDLGPVEALPVDSLVAVGFAELLVGRDSAGVYAMTSRCTHQQCNMIGNDGIMAGNITVCGCHNSNFDPNGVPISGPANDPLAHFDVLINDALHIGVNKDMVVDINQRTPVPA